MSTIRCCAAFGPNDGYFYNSPNKWSRKNLPEPVNEIFTETKPECKLREVFEMALAPDGSYVVIYKTNAGIQLRHAGLPPALKTWLAPGQHLSADRDWENLQITLGPNKSYFAFDGTGSCWANLPDKLNKEIAKRRDAKGAFTQGNRPASVGLGPDGSFVFITMGGGSAWNLKGPYDGLNRLLRGTPRLEGYSIVLSPCSAGIDVVIRSNGLASGTYPAVHEVAHQGFVEDWRSSVHAWNAAEVAKQNAAKQTAVDQPVVQQNSVDRGLRGTVSSNGDTLRTAVAVGKVAFKGLGLLANVVNAANGNGGGGGGNAFFAQDNSVQVPDTSSFWTPIQGAASDPIQ